MPREFIPPDTCPVCGEAVPPGARACPGCGADERSGWDEDSTRYDDLNLPEDAFADDQTPPPPKLRGGGKLWLGLGAITLAVLIFALLRR